jgi:hypothetical protein
VTSGERSRVSCLGSARCARIEDARPSIVLIRRPRWPLSAL